MYIPGRIYLFFKIFLWGKSGECIVYLMFSIVMPLNIAFFHHIYQFFAYQTDWFCFKLHKKVTYRQLF